MKTYYTLIIMSLFLQTIEKLPDKVLLNVFCYLSHREICRVARVCKRWRQIAYDTRLWKHVSLRPEISGLHVSSLENLLHLIRWREIVIPNYALFKYFLTSVHKLFKDEESPMWIKLVISEIILGKFIYFLNLSKEFDIYVNQN